MRPSPRARPARLALACAREAAGGGGLVGGWGALIPAGGQRGPGAQALSDRASNALPRFLHAAHAQNRTQSATPGAALP